MSKRITIKQLAELTGQTANQVRHGLLRWEIPVEYEYREGCHRPMVVITQSSVEVYRHRIRFPRSAMGRGFKHDLPEKHPRIHHGISAVQGSRYPTEEEWSLLKLVDRLLRTNWRNFGEMV